MAKTSLCKRRREHHTHIIDVSEIQLKLSAWKVRGYLLARHLVHMATSFVSAYPGGLFAHRLKAQVMNYYLKG